MGCAGAPAPLSVCVGGEGYEVGPTSSQGRVRTPGSQEKVRSRVSRVLAQGQVQRGAWAGSWRHWPASRHGRGPGLRMTQWRISELRLLFCPSSPLGNTCPSDGALRAPLHPPPSAPWKWVRVCRTNSTGLRASWRQAGGTRSLISHHTPNRGKAATR